MAIATKSELLVQFQRELHVFGVGEDRVIIGAGCCEEGDALQSVKFKGPVLEGDMSWGLTYRLFGRWIEHEKYGNQFVFQSFVLSRPHDRRGIVKYLEVVGRNGIGPATAEKIWQKYSGNAVEMLRENPDAVAAVIPRLGVQQARAASQKLKDMQARENVTIELMGLFHGRGLPSSLTERCIEKWGVRAPEAIRGNPYALIQFPGVGFLTADRLYLECGGDPADIKRQAWCVWNAANASTGDTWQSWEAGVGALKSSISSAEVQVNEAYELAKEMELVVVRTDQAGRKWVTTRSRALQEHVVAERVVDLIDAEPHWPDMSDCVSLTPHQQDVIAQALRGPVALLIGTPGTGKTWTAGCVARAVIEEYGPGALAVAAPTGKAAVRIGELMAQMGVFVQATTIHSLLRVEKGGDDGWSFFHGQHEPLPYKFILIDESSMLDVFLASALLDACAAGTHILFIGDTNQLPPVGHGSPMRDMIAAGIPCGELTEIHRNGGQIVKTCQAMRRDREFPTSDKWDLAAGENLFLVNAGSPASQIGMLESTLSRIIAGGNYDPKWQVQVICAVNKKSPVSREELNRLLQDRLNRHGARDEREMNPFRCGDKIICLKNSRLPAADPEDPLAINGKIYVANGEIAEVTGVEVRRTFATLQSPYREIIIPRGKGQEDDKDEEAAGAGCNWSLGYAISAHKSQGSSWPIVIVMLDSSGGASRVCDLGWLYTAVSRAEKGCLLIGKQTDARDFCRRSNLHFRKTFLREIIEEQRQVLGVF